MKRAVVTGGAGFIGHHLVKRLLTEGYQVVVIDDLSSGSLLNLAGLEVQVHVLDISRDELPSLDFTELYHLGGPVSVAESLQNPTKYRLGILEGSRRVFDWAIKSGCRKVVAASTAAVYGEPVYVPIDETHRKAPLSPYAESKLQMEELMAGLHAVTSTSFTALRFFNVYGEGQRDSGGYASAVPVFLKQYESFQPITVTGDGNQTRDWVYVSDVVSAIRLAARASKRRVMPIYNVGTGEETRVLDLAEAFGGEIVLTEARQEPSRSLADSSSIRLNLGWKPETNLIEWVKRVK